MIGYTFVNGRGSLHAYGFTASTEVQPYAAPWASEARARETRGNQPVVELQAARFGELILIFSQVVSDRGREFGYTQYIHPVPEAADRLPEALPDAMAAMAPRLLSFNEFLTTEAFLQLDDDPTTAHRMLEPQHFKLPAVPDAPPETLDQRMLGELLADVWRVCDARIHGSKDVIPVRIAVCNEANADRTLKQGLLFVAKTLIAKLPAPVVNILSVTIGAEWPNVNSYGTTACCVAQHRQLDAAVGYNLFNGLYANRLSPEERDLGMALVSGKDLNYYQQVLKVMGNCPLTADYRIALVMVVLHKYLSMDNRVIEDLEDCSRLWVHLQEDILTRYGDVVDERLCRQLLLPIEADILRLQARLSLNNAPAYEVHRGLLLSAFTMRQILDDGKVDLTELREAYASALALPPRFSNLEGRPFVVHMGDERLSSLLMQDVPLFARALALYLHTFCEKEEADRDTIDAIHARMQNCTPEDQQMLRDTVLKPYVLSCMKAGQNQRAIVALCESFGLDFATFRDDVMERFGTALHDSRTSDDELISFFRFAELAGDDAMRGKMLKALDANFTDRANRWDDVERYMGQCRQLRHVDQASLEAIWAYVTRRFRQAPMSESNFTALLALSKEAELPNVAERAAWNYFATVELSPRNNPEISAQMTQVATQFPGILQIQKAGSDAWDYFRSEKTTDGMKTAFDQLRTWGDLSRTLRSRWTELAGLTYLQADAWDQLPQLVGMEKAAPAAAPAPEDAQKTPPLAKQPPKSKLRAMAEETYARVMSTAQPTLSEAQSQLDYVLVERDWLSDYLSEPVCLTILHWQHELWRATTTLETAQKLQSMISRASQRIETVNLPTTPEVTDALTLLMKASALVARFREPRGWPTPAFQQEVERMICAVGASPEGLHIAEVLRHQYVGTLASMQPATRFLMSCLLHVQPQRGVAAIQWEDLLTQQESDARLAPETLEHVDPWSPDGMPVLRTLLLLLRLCDDLFLENPELRTLGYALLKLCPRFTGAVRKKSQQRKHLPRLFDPRGALLQTEAVQSYSSSAVNWMFSK